MALINILQEALKKIEYALRKASITDYERIQDIRIVVYNAISEIEIYCPDTGNESAEVRLLEAILRIEERWFMASLSAEGKDADCLRERSTTARLILQELRALSAVGDEADSGTRQKK